MALSPPTLQNNNNSTQAVGLQAVDMWERERCTSFFMYYFKSSYWQVRNAEMSLTVKGDTGRTSMVFWFQSGCVCVSMWGWDSNDSHSLFLVRASSPPLLLLFPTPLFLIVFPNLLSWSFQAPNLFCPTLLCRYLHIEMSFFLIIPVFSMFFYPSSCISLFLP